MRGTHRGDTHNIADSKGKQKEKRRSYSAGVAEQKVTKKKREEKSHTLGTTVSRPVDTVRATHENFVRSSIY